MLYPLLQKWSLLIYYPFFIFIHHFVQGWKGHSYMAGSFRYGFIFALFGGISDANRLGLDINSPEGRVAITNRLIDRVVLTVYGCAIVLIVGLTVFPSRASERYYRVAPGILAAFSGALDMLTSAVSSEEPLSEEDSAVLASFMKTSDGLLKVQAKDAELAVKDWALWYVPFEGVDAAKLSKCNNGIKNGLSMMSQSLSPDTMAKLKENGSVHTILVSTMESIRELMNYGQVVVEAGLAGKVEDLDLEKLRIVNVNLAQLLEAAAKVGLSSVRAKAQSSEKHDAKVISCMDRFLLSLILVINSLNEAVALLGGRFDLAEKSGKKHVSHLCSPWLSADYTHKGDLIRHVF